MEDRHHTPAPGIAPSAAAKPPRRRFTRDELRSFTGGTLPDLLPDPTRLLLAGINPGLLSVAVQAHFATPGNRFYPALYRGGVVDRLIDASSGFTPSDLAHLQKRGIGITCIVPRATARAAELGRDELRAAGATFRERVATVRPRVIAFLGISAYRVAFDAPHAQVGRQPGEWDGAEIWVVPNPSGLNAHASLSDLAAAYRGVAVRAGLEMYAPPSSSAAATP